MRTFNLILRGLILIILFSPQLVLAEQNIATSTRLFYDQLRNRSILVELYYPTEDTVEPIAPFGFLKRAKSVRNGSYINQKHPLVMVSHGYGGNRLFLSWFCEGLAQKGYIVAAVDHYGNTSYFDSPEIALARWHRPKDITFVLNSLLLERNTKLIVDQSKVYFAGYSLGGLTGIWLAGGVANAFTKPNLETSSPYELARDVRQKDIDDVDYSAATKSYQDKRIHKYFLMAPAHGYSFTEEGLSKVSKPIFIVVGEKDEVTPVEQHAAHFAKYTQAQLHVFKGNISHHVFRTQAHPDYVKSVPPYWLETTQPKTQARVQKETLEMALDFFSEEAKENS